eukprot:TRINITY_DN43528_c0_g1_i1.p1 TRINITY_DN43528_c0_g1~~TRINITY_DN43528_c0_g1_i1.p1  ORF type:complete len:378 (+),score=91.64 TRINITY_DN43528_c0_g1_i1:98-1231(+)
MVDQADAPSLLGGGLAHAVLSNLGHSHALEAVNDTKPITINGITLPAIPEGTPTTMMMVPVPLTTVGPPPAKIALEEGKVVAFLIVAAVIWALPFACINQKCCCTCFKRFMSRRITPYFVAGLVLNVIFFGIVVNSLPDVSVNDLFFQVVAVVEKVSDHLEELLNQIVPLVGGVLLFTFRKRIIALLGFDTGIVKADLRDVMTFFSANRFKVIELALLKVEGLPPGLTSRTLYCRIVLGFNEPLHTRPHEGCTTSLSVKERMQLNYDETDDTTKLTMLIKQQEVVSSAVQQFAPAAGALVGATMLPLPVQAGAVAGASIGMGAANSLGVEVARVELSCAQINRLVLGAKEKATGKTSVGVSRNAVAWAEGNFIKVFR